MSETVAAQQVWIVMGETQPMAVYDNEAAAAVHAEHDGGSYVEAQPILHDAPQVYPFCTVTLVVSWTNVVCTTEFHEGTSLEPTETMVVERLPYKDWNGHWVDTIPVASVYGTAPTWQQLYDRVVELVNIVGGRLVDVSGGRGAKTWQPVQGFCRWDEPPAYAYATPPTNLPNIEPGDVQDVGYSRAVLFQKADGMRGWFIPDTATPENVDQVRLAAMREFRDTLAEGSDERHTWDLKLDPARLAAQVEYDAQPHTSDGSIDYAARVES